MRYDIDCEQPPHARHRAHRHAHHHARVMLISRLVLVGSSVLSVIPCWLSDFMSLWKYYTPSLAFPSGPIGLNAA